MFSSFSLFVLFLLGIVSSHETQPWWRPLGETTFMVVVDTLGRDVERESRLSGAEAYSRLKGRKEGRKGEKEGVRVYASLVASTGVVVGRRSRLQGTGVGETVVRVPPLPELLTAPGAVLRRRQTLPAALCALRAFLLCSFLRGQTLWRGRPCRTDAWTFGRDRLLSSLLAFNCFLLSLFGGRSSRFPFPATHCWRFLRFAGLWGFGKRIALLRWGRIGMRVEGKGRGG